MAASSASGAPALTAVHAPAAATGWRALLRPPAACCLGLFAITFATYVLTLQPGVGFADSGELAVAVATRGVAHPPGFPLYLVLAGWFAALPLGGDVAWRLNLFSALVAAMSSAVLYLAGRRAFREVLLHSRGPGGDAVGSTAEAIPGETADDDARGMAGRALSGRSLLPMRLLWRQLRYGGGGSSTDRAMACEAAGLSGALLFAFSLTFWRQATITEVYTLNMLMTGTLLLLTAGYLGAERRESPRARWWLAGIGLAAGLGGANHLTLVLMLPGIALLIACVRWRGIGALLGRIWLPALTTMLGLCIYAVLPLRAHAEPALAWGNPDTFDRFWRHITGWQFRVNFKPTGDVIAKQLGVFFHSGFREVGLLPLQLLPVGVLSLLLRDRLLALALAISFAIPLGYSLCYDIAEDQETYFLIPFQQLALVMGLGAGELVLVSRLRWGAAGHSKWLAAAVVLGVAISPLAFNFSRADRRHQTEAQAYGHDLLAAVGENGVVFTRQWNVYGPCLYYQHLYALRPDVDVLDLNLLRYSFYGHFLRRATPRVISGLDAQLGAFEELQGQWEAGKLPEAEWPKLQGLYEDLIAAMVQTAWRRGRPVYATAEMVQEFQSPSYAEYFSVHFTPDSLAARLHPQPIPYELPPLEFANRWEHETWEPVIEQVYRSYRTTWTLRGRYYQQQGRLADAARAYDQALAVPGATKAGREGLEEARRKLGVK